MNIKNVFLFVFELSTWKNAKMQAKDSVILNEKTLGKRCIMRVLELLRQQNTKTHEFYSALYIDKSEQH